MAAAQTCIASRGELLGARGELLGTMGGRGPDLHSSQGQLWLLEVLGARTLLGPCGPYLGLKFRLYESLSENFTIQPTKLTIK